MLSSTARQPSSPSSSTTVPSSSSSRHPGIINLALVPESPTAAHRHHAYNTGPIDDASLDASEIHANMAMISDGSRYNGGSRVDSSQLPPYSPGNQRTMDGHGGENNDTLLSEYVKGETRAQDIKDTGNF